MNWTCLVLQTKIIISFIYLFFLPYLSHDLLSAFPHTVWKCFTYIFSTAQLTTLVWADLSVECVGEWRRWHRSVPAHRCDRYTQRILSCSVGRPLDVCVHACMLSTVCSRTHTHTRTRAHAREFACVWRVSCKREWASVRALGVIVCEGNRQTRHIANSRLYANCN